LRMVFNETLYMAEIANKSAFEIVQYTGVYVFGPSLLILVFVPMIFVLLVAALNGSVTKKNFATDFLTWFFIAVALGIAVGFGFLPYLLNTL